MDTTRLVATAGTLLALGSLTSCGVVQAAASPFSPHETVTADPVPGPTATVDAPTPTITSTRPSASPRASAPAVPTREATPRSGNPYAETEIPEQPVTKAPGTSRGSGSSAGAGGNAGVASATLLPYDMGAITMSMPASYRMQEITNDADRKAGVDRVDGGAVGDLDAPDLVVLVFHRPAPDTPPTDAQVESTLTKISNTAKALPEKALTAEDSDMPHGCTGVRSLVIDPTRTASAGLRAEEDAYDCASAKSSEGTVRVFEVAAIDRAGGVHVLRLSATPTYRAEHMVELQQVFTSMTANA